MIVVKCFRYDAWINVNVLDLENGDIFSHKGSTYITTGEPRILDGKPHVPAELYDSGPIILAIGKGRDFIYMAMDYVNSPAHNFGDGTMQICKFEDGNTNVYSPRLPITELNEFCKENINQYESFFHKNERHIESGESIEMPKFW